MSKRRLVLEDGTVMDGIGFGYQGEVNGEMIFNTGMTGYEHVLSDPSYCGQLVVMTSPKIGTNGINQNDCMSAYLNGLIVKDYGNSPNSSQNAKDLNSFLLDQQIPGLANIDTRMLTKHIRQFGTLKGSIVDVDTPIDMTIKKLKNVKDSSDQVQRVSTQKPYVIPGKGSNIVVIDLGMKLSILRELTARDCQVTVVPYNYSADQIIRLKPDGIFITSGPGNPKNLPETIATIQQLPRHIPVFGIGLGHQVMALGFGAETEKMLYGHHGNNYPVKDLLKQKSYMTSQNHLYSVSRNSLQNTDLEITHIGLNDDAIEGLRHKSYSYFSVQFQPEGKPGPEDMHYLYDEFLTAIQHDQAKNKEDMYVEKY
ncbi:carbamoyl phosphate synthase small subunit [Allobacillus sp. GCM10007491]|uniref:Carbamoyl phosphate synthase small chain n=1 Tax=Allobacillus saliphilus TaxID=2912308 RepID=A0A941CXC7_9BACI|nr:carbamoyl phosphate synthase small subunit [Allobacillus saliphilus]MBR7554909.1 carbamoyl phosphate synthase small subunit [Allobacillus saliphilus]